MSAPAKPARKSAPKPAPRKRAPRKAAAAPTAAPAPPAVPGLEPIRIGERAPEPVEMVTLFTIDDRDYQIAKAPSPQVGLRFLRQAQDPQIGVALAVSNLVVEVLGPENLLALEQSPKVTREDLRDVFRAVRRHVLGPEGDLAIERLLAGAADPS